MRVTITTIVTALTLGFGAAPALPQSGSGASSSASVTQRQPDGGSSSSQAAPTPSARNAAQDALAECMQLWEPATHMTKREWSRTCRRVQTRLDQITKQFAETDDRQKKAAPKSRQ